jgi:hypothetical protein
MLLTELYDYYGTWTLLGRELGLGNSTYQVWRRQGYIPFTAQLLIENKTKGLFKACEAQGKPPEPKRAAIISRREKEMVSTKFE